MVWAIWGLVMVLIMAELFNRLHLHPVGWILIFRFHICRPLPSPPQSWGGYFECIRYEFGFFRPLSG